MSKHAAPLPAEGPIRATAPMSRHERVLRLSLRSRGGGGGRERCTKPDTVLLDSDHDFPDAGGNIMLDQYILL